MVTVVGCIGMIALMAFIPRCDDKPIDVGVPVQVTAPCAEAAVPYIPPAPYVPTSAELEAVKLIENWDLQKPRSKAEDEARWKRYHDLNDASRLEHKARDR